MYQVVRTFLPGFVSAEKQDEPLDYYISGILDLYLKDFSSTNKDVHALISQEKEQIKARLKEVDKGIMDILNEIIIEEE